MSESAKGIHNLPEIASAFYIYGDFVEAVPYGSGHINDTFAATYDQSGRIVRYVFQRINHNVFKNPPALMDNVLRVTNHVKEKLSHLHDSSRRTLTLALTHNEKPFYRDSNGNYWRAYLFIEGASTYDIIESPEQARLAAKAFGEFQGHLVDLKGPRLSETIPDFHNTPSRLANLDAAVKADVCGRVKELKAELDFVEKRRHIVSHLLDLNAKGLIPERTTHNDTKLNNVMLDDETGEGICVIDLDTVMPGLALYDFGDLVRTSTSPAAEDEKDLSKVAMQMPMFKALAEGYIQGAGHFLTDSEIENMAFSGKLITFEIGLRFLTDYLSGDKYFKIKRPEHNLDRCRTQFKLVERIEEQEAEMNAYVASLKKTIRKKGDN